MSRKSLEKRYLEYILKPVVNKISITSGKGVELFDAAGKRYLDLTTGGGISILGYHNPYTDYVKNAAQKQMERLTHLNHYIYYSEPALELAEKLAEITPGSLKRIFFCNSGSEAVEGAIRTIRKYKRKFELLGLQQGFMGRTMGAVSLTGLNKDKKMIGPLLPGVHHIPAPYCYRCSLNHTYPICDIACASYVEDYLKFGTCGAVAAAVVEPILGDVGVIEPPDEYFGFLKSIFQRHDVAWVVDETLTGFGRTGKMFAVEYTEIEPEIMTMGKALGGGFPLGAFIVTDRVAEVFEYDDFSSTAGGNPVACAAGLATIEIVLKEGLLDKVAMAGAYFKKLLQELAATTPTIGQVRGKGLFIGVEIVDKQNQIAAPQIAHSIREQMVQKGFLFDIFGLSSIRLTPPLIIENHDIDRFVGALDSVIRKAN
jgi:4-aminobutyrate aminotransferase-like enzyme